MICTFNHSHNHNQPELHATQSQSWSALACSLIGLTNIDEAKLADDVLGIRQGHMKGFGLKLKDIRASTSSSKTVFHRNNRMSIEDEIQQSIYFVGFENELL